MNAQVVHAQIEAPVAKTTRVAPLKLTHYLAGGRPNAGNALFAHTAAVFELMGMTRGAKVPRATLSKIMGETAVKYHLNTTRVFDWDDKGISLHDFGRLFFSSRKIDPELKAAFIEVLSTGKTNDKVMKNATFIKPI